MAAIGHPIVGDAKYGGPEAFLTGGISRKLHLHARRIRIDAPDGGTIDVTADLPAHFAESLATLGFDPLAGECLPLETPKASPGKRRVAAAAKARRRERRASAARAARRPRRNGDERRRRAVAAPAAGLFGCARWPDWRSFSSGSRSSTRIWFARGGWPQLGAVIAIMGAIDAVFAPRLLKKVWDQQSEK